MEEFRHNLSPVEVKTFLRTIAEYRENLLIRYCYKTQTLCPQCSRNGVCRSGAISLFSSSFDKMTHEITACLHCGHKEISAVLTIEKL
jgi:hypothetical protein